MPVVNVSIIDVLSDFVFDLLRMNLNIASLGLHIHIILDCQQHEDMDVDLDRDFLIGLREVRVFTDKEILDEHKV